MPYSGFVKDNVGRPIAGATVQALDASGYETGVGTYTDATGHFTIPDTLIAGDWISITSIGFKGQSIGIERFVPGMVFKLAIDVKALPPVVVTSGHNRKSAALAFVAGSLLLAEVEKRNSARYKRNGVGKIDKSDVQTGLYIVGGLMLIGAVNKIATMFGFSSGPGGSQSGAEQSNPYSPWKPNYWRYANTKTAVLLLTNAAALDYAKKIQNAFAVLQDNFNEIMGVFSQLRTKTQVSFLADIFQQKYNQDLLTFLRDAGGLLPWDGLSDDHLKIITDLVAAMPDYK